MTPGRILPVKHFIFRVDMLKDLVVSHSDKPAVTRRGRAGGGRAGMQVGCSGLPAAKHELSCSD